MVVDGMNMDYVGECSNKSTGANWCLMIKNKKTGKVNFKRCKFVTFNPEVVQRVDIDEEETDKKTYDKIKLGLF